MVSASADRIVLSNDSGFGAATTVDVAPAIPWRLEVSGAEREPRTVYARFEGPGATDATYSDDIVLDRTPPRVRARARRRGPRRVRVAVSARDRTSGVAGVQVTARRSRPGKLLRARTVVLRTRERRAFVRGRDRAGNVSRWRRVRIAAS